MEMVKGSTCRFLLVDLSQNANKRKNEENYKVECNRLLDRFHDFLLDRY